MAINLAGIELPNTDDAGNVQAWFDDWLPLSDSRMILEWPDPEACFSGSSSYYTGQSLPHPNYSKPIRPKLNTWYRPTGAARWSFGFFLCDYQRLQILLSAIGSANAPVTLKLGYSPHSRSWGGCYLLPPHPVSYSISITDGLWLLPVVDERWYWQFATGFETPIDATAPGATTWAGFLGTVGAALGTTLSVDTVPATYLYPDLFAVNGTSPHNTATMLDVAAWSVGQRIVPDYGAMGPDGNWPGDLWKSANWTTSAARKAANLLLQYDHGGLQSGVLATFPQQPALVPQSVDVAFRAYKDGVVIHDWKQARYVSSVPSLTANFPGGSTSAFSATVLSTALADYSTGVLANSAALNALALQIAQDFYAGIWIQDSAVVGISQWQESGYDDYVEFSAGRVDGADGQIRTRIHSAPYNLVQQNMFHYDSSTWEYGPTIYGTLDGTLAAGGTQTITVTGGDGATPAPAQHVNVTNIHNITGVAGQVLTAIRAGDKWIVIAKDCP